MDRINKTKWQVRGAAVIIFVLGLAAGALGLNAFQRWSNARGTPNAARFEQMLDRLELNADQKAQVHQIFANARAQLQEVRKAAQPRFAEIRQQTDEKLQNVLTPEQWQKFQREREEMRNRNPRRGRGPENANH